MWDVGTGVFVGGGCLNDRFRQMVVFSVQAGLVLPHAVGRGGRVCRGSRALPFLSRGYCPQLSGQLRCGVQNGQLGARRELEIWEEEECSLPDDCYILCDLGRSACSDDWT